ncbi:MAG TPA: slipin family protein [Fimbriimonadaceae bacterium]|nr:slipin family protein [Fimbriimonadaceae bacterium]HRJ32270.1 slipin family protein [Fimbriimonadaceae bacterium]
MLGLNSLIPIPAKENLPTPATTNVGSSGIPNPIPFVIFLLSMGVGWAIFGSQLPALAGVVGLVGSGIVGGLLGSMVRIAAQWEKALIFRLGQVRAVKGPGPFILVPFLDAARMVDTRIQTLDIPRRQAITKDNVPVSLDGVIFMKVTDPQEAVTKVRNYQFAIQQYAQTALRDIVGSMTLDQILIDRELVGEKIEEMVEAEIEGWGIEVLGIRIQDIELPEDLKRVMARQASAEREKRATITKAEGDRDAAENLAKAAETMYTSPGAMQLRTLQTLDALGTSSSNTTIIALPMELTQALQSISGLASGAKSSTPASRPSREQENSDPTSPTEP